MIKRSVEPEWLDELPAEEMRAVRSRKDLKRINILMRHVHFMERLWRKANVNNDTRRIVDLGAGDGSFFLKLARRLAPDVNPIHAVLVDRQNLIGMQTRQEFANLGWTLEYVTADIFDWLLGAGIESGTALIANLFLHHFGGEDLLRMFGYISCQSNFFVACEPRRAFLALNAARLLGAIGCNSVSRHDAPISVRAGFKGSELSALWPHQTGWQLDEHEAGLFSHCFLARRLGSEDCVAQAS
jgi:hypothetical protein